VTSVDVSPRGDIIASASVDHTVRVWQSNVRGTSFAIRTHVSAVRQVSFSSDGKFLITASNDKTSKVMFCSVALH